MLSRSALRLLSAMTVMAGLFGACGQPNNTGTVQPAEYRVAVGAEAGADTAGNAGAARWQTMRFYPTTLTVNEGDTVVWVSSTPEPHTVTFLKAGEASPPFIVPENSTGTPRLIFNPLGAFPFPAGNNTYAGSGYYNSGLMDQEPNSPKEYRLTFTKAGTYQYLCLLHGSATAAGEYMGMVGTVVVKPRNTPRERTPEQVQADALNQIKADQAAALALEAEAAKVPGPTTVNGVTTHTVHTGYAKGLYDFMRYAPTELTVKVGDKVKFVNPTAHTPHTATFTSGEPAPALVLPEPQPQGPPLLVINPVVLAPSSSATYSGTGYANTGLLFGQMDPEPHSHALTFDTPGTYDYFCALHANLGMRARITVVPK